MVRYKGAGTADNNIEILNDFTSQHLLRLGFKYLKNIYMHSALRLGYLEDIADMTPVVYVIKNDRPVDIMTFQYLMRFVPEERKERILRQRVRQNADNMLVGTVLAKYMLLKFFGIPFSAQHISYGRYGKPCLRDYSNAQFSISHSGQFVACAVSDCSIGVDIQEIVPYRRDVAKHVFYPEELLQIESNPDPSVEFTKLWTQKEAYLKMLGIGFSDSLYRTVLPRQSKAQTTRYMNVFISIQNRDSAEDLNYSSPPHYQK